MKKIWEYQIFVEFYHIVMTSHHDISPRIRHTDHVIDVTKCEFQNLVHRGTTAIRKTEKRMVRETCAVTHNTSV